MTIDEARSSVMGAISMALKDPILQQGFEIICKNLSELEKENKELQEENEQLKKENAEYESEAREVNMRMHEYIIKTVPRLTKAIGIVKILKDDLSMYSGAYQKEIAEAEQFLSEAKQ